jgi:hypothetical protein
MTGVLLPAAIFIQPPVPHALWWQTSPLSWVPAPCHVGTSPLSCGYRDSTATGAWNWSLISMHGTLPLLVCAVGGVVPRYQNSRARPGVIALFRDLMYCNVRNCDAVAKHVVLSQFLLHSLTLYEVLINVILLFPCRSSQFPLSGWFHVHDPVATVPCLFEVN